MKSIYNILTLHHFPFFLLLPITMSNRASNSSNRAHSSGSGSSNVSSVAEVARPGTSSGPRTTTANTHFYAMEPRGVDDSVQRPPSSTSVPSYHSNSRPPTYRAQQPGASSDRASAVSSNISGPPPSYHSTDPIVSAPRPASRGQGPQGSRQQAQPQAQPQSRPDQPQGQQRRSTRERLMGAVEPVLRAFRSGERNQGSGSGRRR